MPDVTPASLGPRDIPLSTLVFKSLAGFGVGGLGTIILLIFSLFGFLTAQATMTSPFLAFVAIVMGLIVSLVVNGLGVTAFSLIDQRKYPPLRATLHHVAMLNIAIFIFLLPVYAIAATGALTTILLVVALELVLSAQASAFTLELIAAKNSERGSLLAVYGVTFAMLFAILSNIAIFSLFAYFLSTGLATDAGGQTTKSAVTAVLFSVLPLTWFFFGFLTTMTEMIYRWFYVTWGVDYLSTGAE